MFKGSHRVGQSRLAAALLALKILVHGVGSSADREAALKTFVRRSPGLMLRNKKSQNTLQVTRTMVEALHGAHHDPIVRQALLCTSIVRYVDNLAKGYMEHGSSIRALCLKKHLPLEIVEIRHRIAHADLPSTSTLRLAADTCLRHAFKWTWEPLLGTCAPEADIALPDPKNFADSGSVLLRALLDELAASVLIDQSSAKTQCLLSLNALKSVQSQIVALADKGAFSVNLFVHMMVMVSPPRVGSVDSLTTAYLRAQNLEEDGSTVRLEIECVLRIMLLEILRGVTARRSSLIHQLVESLITEVFEPSAERGAENVELLRSLALVDAGASQKNALGWLEAMKDDLILEAQVKKGIASVRHSLFHRVMVDAIVDEAAVPSWFASLC